MESAAVMIAKPPAPSPTANRGRKPIAEPEKPKAVPVAKVEPESTLHSIEAIDGRIPQPGMLVLFHMQGAGGLDPRPSWLYGFSKVTGKWTLAMMYPGGVRSQPNVTYSKEPANCCWSWSKSDDMGLMQQKVVALEERVTMLEMEVETLSKKAAVVTAL